MFSALNADRDDVVIDRHSWEGYMKMNPIDLSELTEVEELEEKSVPSADACFLDGFKGSLR